MIRRLQTVCWSLLAPLAMFSLAMISLATISMAPAPAFAQDQVQVRSGPAVTGEITSVSKNELEIKTRQGARKIATRDIVRLGFENEPSEVKTARQRIGDRQYKEALVLLGRIDAESVKRPELQANLAFLKATANARVALTGGGDKNAAAAELVNYVNNNADSVHYYAACETLGELAFSMGRFEVADTFFGKVAEAPWKDYELRAKRLKAQALYNGEKFAESNTVYGEILASTADDADSRRQKLFAEVGQAVCTAQTGEIDAAVKRLQDVIRTNDSTNVELFGRAYNGLGVSHLKAGRPEDALLAFLHVDLLFSKSAEAHAESLFYLNQLWTTVKKPDRAVSAKNRLQQQYGGTVWASKE